MRTSIVIARVAALALFAAPAATHLLAAVALPNLPAGTKYELIFVTKGTIAGNAGAAAFAELVTQEATDSGLTASLPGGGVGVTWTAILTDGANGGNIAAADSPIAGPANVAAYNTQADQLANGGIYDGTLINAVKYDASGAAVAADADGINGLVSVWTRLNIPGDPTHHQYGDATSNAASWFNFTEVLDSTQLHHLYAISSVITAPEPSTFVLLVTACLVIGGMRLRRHSATC